MIGICWDITERKQVEEALRQSERDLLEAQELAHIGSYALDLRTQQLTWSDEMFRVWGLDRSRGAPRESIRELMHPADYERLRSTRWRPSSTGLPTSSSFASAS